MRELQGLAGFDLGGNSADLCGNVRECVEMGGVCVNYFGLVLLDGVWWHGSEQTINHSFCLFSSFLVFRKKIAVFVFSHVVFLKTYCFLIQCF